MTGAGARSPSAAAERAVALVRALDAATTPQDADALSRPAAALGLAPRMPGDPGEELRRGGVAGLRRHLWDAYGPALEERFGLPLCRHLTAVVADAEAGPPDAVATAGALARLARQGRMDHRQRPSGPLQRSIEATAAALAESVGGEAERLRRTLETPDAPDLRAVSLMVLRIEGVRWVLDILDHPPALARLSRDARRLSRRALGRSAETIRGFIAARDLLSLYDNASVVSQVDHLLTLAGRLLDALRDGEEERTAFVAPDDETALRGFGAALADLADVLGRIALRSVAARDLSPALAVTALKQLHCLHLLASRLGPDRPPEFETLELVIARQAEAAALALRGARGQSAGLPDEAHREQAAALSLLLHSLGLEPPAKP
ncbi:hypothetical protein [Azospirillum thermophilum]|uniref:Uncharacterized protein n=1 Tax=Azospirillum thermophilum TaxID=2202148 RepID=A0A2S2CRV1_9PROT|nr:hypothetical protein [Azospirillum thermophilum]AWK87212.1 hypothetical protein DEW08_14170 [Azospirillum thermophilum]